MCVSLSVSIENRILHTLKYKNKYFWYLDYLSLAVETYSSAIDNGFPWTTERDTKKSKVI